MNVIIFGAGTIGRKYYEDVKSGGVDIVAFCDNGSSAIGESFKTAPIIPPTRIADFNYDKVVVAFADEIEARNAVEQLQELGVDDSKIDLTTCLPYYYNSRQRIRWLNSFAEYIMMNKVSGSVCECGVYRGNFAAHINKRFYDQKLYLFDTFTGFSRESLESEMSVSGERFDSGFFLMNVDMYANTNIPLVLGKMQHPENCIIKQGLFPQSAVGVSDSFCFVNLDMDLYAPMLDALHFFWDKMTTGGVILLHDYFSPDLPGVAKAVADFERTLQRTLAKTPIGDNLSIAIIKV